MANEAFSLKSASVRWAGWATVTYGRVGKLKARVGKRKKKLCAEFCPPWPETLPAPLQGVTFFVDTVYIFFSRTNEEETPALQCFDTVGWAIGRASGL